MWLKILSPNVLTMARICAVPLLILFWWLQWENYQWYGLGVYFFACITDYFDGYIARNYNIMTKFGRIMDPISDKILVSCVLLLLVADKTITDFNIIASLIILVREITVSGLREFLQEIQVPMPVSNLAKYKTALQMISLGFLIAPDVNLWVANAHLIGLVALWFASILTMITGYDYLKRGLDHMDD